MKFQLLTLLALGFFACTGPSEAMTLEDYLEEVTQKNGAVRGSKLSSEAKELRKDEATFFFRPSFFLTGEYYDDQRPTNAPTFQGTQTLRHTLKTGLSQNTRFGTKAAVSYNYSRTQIIGASPAVLPNSKFFDVAPMLEVTQSLWRNFLGSEFEAQETVQNGQTEAQKYMDQFTRKQLLLQAETAYWKLYFTQQTLKVQRESLERARKLREWNAGRVRSNLVDESELLQAEANLQAKEVDYQDSRNAIETSLLEFNSVREGSGDVNLEGSKTRMEHFILQSELPKKAPMREDVMSYLAQQKVAVANAELGGQRAKPTLELYGTYSINGRSNQYGNAYEQSVSATRPLSIIGLRFITPVDIGAMSDYRKAYAQEKAAAEMTYKRKTYEVDKEWEILSKRFGNFKTKLKLTQKLEEIQERKLTQEKRRYSQGRTTTFQVLQFEQDYANAQLLRIRNELETIAVYNQLKLFAGDSNEQ